MKIMFVSGLGFFADAYDLCIIGIVACLPEQPVVLDTSQVSSLNAITPAASR